MLLLRRDQAVSPRTQSRLDPARRWSGTAAILIALGALVAPVSAQVVIEPIEVVDSSRPEAWAMRYFAAAARGHRLSSRNLEQGKVALGFEVGSLPSLDEEQERVGFGGTKREDLDRSPLLGRLRAAWGVSDRWTLDLGWIPPVEVDGAEANVGTLGLSRAWPLADRWSLAVRLATDLGRLSGDITCPRDVAASDDPVVNPFVCHEPSTDRLEWESATLELVASRNGLWSPYLAVGTSYVDAVFQVEARYGTLIDRSQLRYHGFDHSIAVGVDRLWRATWGLALEAAFVPLEVDRPSATSTDDDLLNLRLALRYHL